MDTVFIKTYKEVLTPPITDNYEQGPLMKVCSQNTWKITPVFKSGEHMIISNYIHISILQSR